MDFFSKEADEAMRTAVRYIGVAECREMTIRAMLVTEAEIGRQMIDIVRDPAALHDPWAALKRLADKAREAGKRTDHSMRLIEEVEAEGE